MRFKDLTNQKFGRWLVLSKAQKLLSEKRIFWVCLCECGEQGCVAGGDLVSGHSRSCGCYRKDATVARNTRHGKFGTKTHTTWLAMRRRCFDKNFEKYKTYGGRGITVCDRWLDFNNFFQDMGERPEGKTLDRINPEGNYEPGNCRWATAKEQSQNRRRT